MDQTLIESIRAAMRDALPSADDPALAEYYGMMEYHLGWRNAALVPDKAETGKLVRPLLAILACRTFGGEERHALPLAAGIQLLHDFTLIHDDIEDHSAQRRGRATVTTGFLFLRQSGFARRAALQATRNVVVIASAQASMRLFAPAAW